MISFISSVSEAQVVCVLYVLWAIFLSYVVGPKTFEFLYANTGLPDLRDVILNKHALPICVAMQVLYMYSIYWFFDITFSYTNLVLTIALELFLCAVSVTSARKLVLKYLPQSQDGGITSINTLTATTKD